MSLSSSIRFGPPALRRLRWEGDGGRRAGRLAPPGRGTNLLSQPWAPSPVATDDRGMGGRARRLAVEHGDPGGTSGWLSPAEADPERSCQPGLGFVWAAAG